MNQARCYLLIILTCLSVTGFAKTTLGVALVHGTSDHRTDANGGYWKKEFINYFSTHLPDPDNILVVACDYSQYMWDEAAAGCTANQLINFIDKKQITDLTVYTHSDGGNVIRWILSHPTYDSRYFYLAGKIHQVVALSPSSGGTPLADDVFDGTVFTESVGWLLNYRSDAVLQQRVGSMAIYNDQLLYGSAGRPNLPIPFRVVVSSGVEASPFDGSSYCNGIALNAGLKVTQLYLSNCSDGFLDCTSETTAGTTWFYDTEKTAQNLTLSHNQSRHSCFDLEKILVNDLLENAHEN